MSSSSSPIYTVGWVCALPEELLAARESLDEQHDAVDFTSSPNDNNSYTFGRMGKHYVVIAVLPRGEYGTANAAAVARDMVRTFPDIRIGLMVGIGGGAPTSKQDIRLGDVVVSQPGNGKSGVWQYDYGKTIQGQKFHHTGHLNQPPAFLLAAIANLSSRIEADGHDFDRHIQDIVTKKPRLRASYQCPDRETDYLYNSSYLHQDSERACDKVCGKENVLSRRPRTVDEDSPAIFYGLIASANQLMKDAEVRDKLAKEEGVLCFEMEAAGLMNQFPFTVVRGICDYADSHKNKAWQGYAAMTAAAYTKRLLNLVPPSTVEAERRLGDVLESIEEMVDQTLTTSRATHETVTKLGVDRKWDRIDNWLSPPIPSTSHNKAKKQRLRDTGLWFLESDQYREWKAEANSSLWLHGLAGCGKTILTSSIIEDLGNDHEQPACITLYFYFDFNDSAKQSLDNMIRSLVCQLYRQHKESREQLDDLFSSCRDGSEQPSTERLIATLQSMVGEASNIAIVLDALDECTTRRELLSWLASPQIKTSSILLTSRKEQDIELSLIKWLPKASVIPIRQKPVDEDIRAVVRNRIENNNDLQRWRSRPEVCEEIETLLMEKADGMFRWAVCQLDSLEKCLDYPSLKVALRSLPKDLEETYARILESIPLEWKRHTVRVLQFLTFSTRPLRLDEAVDVIAVRLESEPAFEAKNRMPIPKEIARYCSSLTKITTRMEFNVNNSEVEEVEEIQLGHFSVKEYLLSPDLLEEFEPNFREVDARAVIVQVSIAYLLTGVQERRNDKITTNLPLTRFSAQYWMENAVVAEEHEEKIWPWVEKLLTVDDARIYWLSHFNPERPWSGPIVPKEPAAPLYFTCLGGLLKSAERLISLGADVNGQGSGYYSNALQAASARGHDKVVRLLCDFGANVNAQGGGYGNALQAASAGGHEKVVQLLCDFGANINGQGGDYGNALQAASAGGHKKVVRLLCDFGANVNVQGGHYGNALQAASAGGHKKVVRLLCDFGANVNVQGGHYGNALQAASARGHDKVVRLLCDFGANVNAQGGGYGNALQAASARGHEEVVQLLFDLGANINAQGGRYSNALQAASARGHEKVVQLLIKLGANLNALQYASTLSHETVVQPEPLSKKRK